MPSTGPSSLTMVYATYSIIYVDGFFTAGSPGSVERLNNFQAMLLLCENTNAFIKTSKIEGPSTQLTFLGIVIDTDSMTSGISPESKQDFLSSIQFIWENTNVQNTNYSP